MRKLLLRENDGSLNLSHHKKHVIAVVVFIVFFMTVIGSDNMQQKRFAALRNGYELMGNERYEEALAAFLQYREVDSELYWFLLEKANDDRYSRQSVDGAIQICEWALKSH